MFLDGRTSHRARARPRPVASAREGCICKVLNVTGLFKYDLPATGHVGGDKGVSGTVARVKHGVVISIRLTLRLTKGGAKKQGWQRT